MNAGHRLILLSALSLSATTFVPLATAQVVAVENAKFGAAGVVNAGSVAVHSGPGENYYPTAHLDKGTNVTVVGVKFDWLKILPPDGSFSYVAKQYIEKTGETSGKVTRANVNVRVGSQLTPLKATIQCQLQQDDKVEILGEAEEYYKIKPPVGAYLYVNKQYVDATKMLGPTEDLVKTPPAGGTLAAKATDSTPPAQPTGGSDATASAPQTGDTQTVPAGGAGADPNAATADKLANATTTKSTTEVTSAMDAYTKAEKDFFAASEQPIDQQPIAQLTQAYTALAANEKLPASMRGNVQARLQALKLRGDAQQGVLAVRKFQEEGKQRQAALETERQQLQARLNGNQVMVYAAMGQLSTSSLKLGDTPIFRLIDPANARTLVYIRGTDPALAGMLNQFVGVKGDVVADPQLSVNIITPKSVEQIDPTKVNAAAAQIQPLSLKQTASTNDK